MSAVEKLRRYVTLSLESVSCAAGQTPTYGLQDMVGYSPSVWENAKGEAREPMIQAAKSRTTITYGELAAKIRSIRVDPTDPLFYALLEEISREENAAGRGILSAVVVRKGGDKRPGSGFFRLAQELGRETSDREKFWADELQRVGMSWIDR